MSTLNNQPLCISKWLTCCIEPASSATPTSDNVTYTDNGNKSAPGTTALPTRPAANTGHVISELETNPATIEKLVPNRAIPITHPLFPLVDRDNEKIPNSFPEEGVSM